MATPPPVTADDARAAVDRIVERRRRIDDPNAWRLSDDPLDVLSYLRRFSTGIPDWVAEADVLDGLVLRVHVWWLGEQAELWLLEQARRLAIPARRLSPTLGVTTRQAIHDRLRLARRKMARFRGSAGEAQLQRHDQDHAQAVERWLVQRRPELRKIAAAALLLRDDVDDETADWLTEVDRDLQDDALTPGAVQVLRFALAELSICELADPSIDTQRNTLLADWSRLYDTYPQPPS